MFFATLYASFGLMFVHLLLIQVYCCRDDLTADMTLHNQKLFGKKKSCHIKMCFTWKL